MKPPSRAAAGSTTGMECGRRNQNDRDGGEAEAECGQHDAPVEAVG